MNFLNASVNCFLRASHPLSQRNTHTPLREAGGVKYPRHYLWLGCYIILRALWTTKFVSNMLLFISHIELTLYLLQSNCYDRSSGFHFLYFNSEIWSTCCSWTVTFDVQRNFQIGDRIIDICPLPVGIFPGIPAIPLGLQLARLMMTCLPSIWQYYGLPRWVCADALGSALILSFRNPLPIPLLLWFFWQYYAVASRMIACFESWKLFKSIAISVILSFKGDEID